MLGIYIALSWALIEFVGSLASLMGLPEWAPRLALFLLIIGLPVVIATAVVQERPDAPDNAAPAPATPKLDIPERLFTWRNAILGGVAASVLWGVVAVGYVLTRKLGDERVTRIAVLPFENEGAADDAYFAGGVADEIRTKLAGIPGLQVTARASTSQYAKTTKPPKEIGKELGVDYLLTATVRWAKRAGMNRVRLHPELIRVSNATTLWSETIEKELSDVFGAQTEIATKVARELDLALGARAKERLAARPTENLAAWDSYLRGEEITQSLGPIDVATGRRALPHYRRAVELDSTFAEAWSRIARLETEFNRVTPTLEGADNARTAAERALALAPERAAGRLAMGEFLRTAKADYSGAVDQFRQGLAQEPNNYELLEAIARAERTLGRFDSAAVHLRQARDLNPRSVSAYRSLALAYSDVRDFPKALQTAQEAWRLSPNNVAVIQLVSSMWASLGQLDSARAVVRTALSAGVDTTVLIARYALIAEQMWLLPVELLPRVTRLTPAAFDGNRAQWGLKVAATYRLLGDAKRARAYADSGLSAVEKQLENFPDNAELRELRGRMLALAGRTEEAVRDAELSLRMRATTLNATTGQYVKFQVARILVQSGQYDRALDALEPLVDVRGLSVTRAYLRIDPTFAPLHGHPRFEKLTRTGS